MKNPSTQWAQGLCNGNSGIFPLNHVNFEEVSGPNDKEADERINSKGKLVRTVVCVARYDYLAEFDTELSFCRGEKMTIDNFSALDSWHKARNELGIEGLVPYNYVEVL